MISFLKYVLATMVGIALFVGFLFLFGAGISHFFTEAGKVKVKSNSLLVMRLNESIGERAIGDDPLAKLQGQDMEQLGLNDIVKAIRAAKEDASIKGILLNLSSVPGRMVTVDEIRQELVAFKESDKFIYAYGEGWTQMAYYIASVADKVYLNPSGIVELKGFSSETTYFKGTLDKLEIEPQIFYAGKFKSATEPFRRYDMSEENRVQVRALLQGFHDKFVNEVAVSRNMSPESVDAIMQEYKIRKVEDALELGIVDGLKYYDEVIAEIKADMGIELDKKGNTISLASYISSVNGSSKNTAKDRVAVVFAEGNIVDGDGEENSIGSQTYSKILRKLRKDDKVKAVVLRVNSPGGSALASDVMWREIELIKQEGKPVVASMGDLAASGGYFISCNADRIFAEETTITGSIGVFGMFATLDKFFNDKLGMTFDRVKTAPYADFMKSAFRPLQEEEEGIVQNFVDGIYDDFLTRVSEGRNIPVDEVHELAQGRVWTGLQGLENGLVDEIGGLDEAIAHAADLADIEKYRIKSYPFAEDPIQKAMEQITGKKKQEPYIQSMLKKDLPFMSEISAFVNANPYQMRLPFSILIE